MARVLEHLRADISAIWTPKQRMLIVGGLASGGFCRGHIQELKHPNLEDNSKSVIYSWFYIGNDPNLKFMSYVGKTDRKLSKRNSEHLKAAIAYGENPLMKKPQSFEIAMSESVADAKMAADVWKCVPVASYGGLPNQSVVDKGSRCNRLETLHIMVLNTSSARVPTMGYNKDIGGSWGASKI